METIMQANAGTFTVLLNARDQYNDYSVAYDYTVRVINTADGSRRSYDVGSNKNFAVVAYNRALNSVRKSLAA
jgi:hypothetical protein